LGSHLDVHQVIQPTVELEEQCSFGASGQRLLEFGEKLQAQIDDRRVGVRRSLSN
jgi:hypothetical protein